MNKKIYSVKVSSIFNKEDNSTNVVFEIFEPINDKSSIAKKNITTKTVVLENTSIDDNEYQLKINDLITSKVQEIQTLYQRKLNYFSAPLTFESKSLLHIFKNKEGQIENFNMGNFERKKLNVKDRITKLVNKVISYGRTVEESQEKSNHSIICIESLKHLKLYQADFKIYKSSKKNKAFIESTYFPNDGESFKKILKDYIINEFRNGKNVTVEVDYFSVNLIHSLKNEFEKLGLESFNISRTMPPSQKVKEEMKSNITSFLDRKYDTISNLNINNILVCDGSYYNAKSFNKISKKETFKNKKKRVFKNDVISGAYLLSSNDLKLEISEAKSKISEPKYSNSNASELMALEMGIDRVIKEGLINKPLQVIFDSDYTYKGLQQALALKICNTNKYMKDFQRIAAKIKDSGLEIYTHVIKSHQDEINHSEKHDIVKMNEYVDEIAGSSAQILFHSKENTIYQKNRRTISTRNNYMR